MDWFEQGGAAFPIPHSNETGALRSEHGMSLRDWFAGQILSGVMAGASGLGEMPKAERAELLKATTSLIYEAADAMLAERAK